MRRVFFLLGLAITLSLGASAQTFKVTDEKGKRIISCTQYNSGLDEDLEFAKVMKWAINRGEEHRDGISAIDFYSRTLVTDFAWDDDDIKFSSKLQIQVTKTQYIFSFFDIVAQGGGGLKSLIGIKMDFNKINPEKKEKHKQMQNMFMTKAQQAVTVAYNRIVDSNVDITNWTNVTNGRLEKGMTLDEAFLIYGKPITLNRRDNEIQADFNTFTHVLFVNNRVVRIF